jgi:hypothetical protein
MLQHSLIIKSTERIIGNKFLWGILIISNCVLLLCISIHACNVKWKYQISILLTGFYSYGTVTGPMLTIGVSQTQLKLSHRA